MHIISWSFLIKSDSVPFA